MNELYADFDETTYQDTYRSGEARDECNSSRPYNEPALAFDRRLAAHAYTPKYRPHMVKGQERPQEFVLASVGIVGALLRRSQNHTEAVRRNGDALAERIARVASRLAVGECEDVFALAVELNESLLVISGEQCRFKLHGGSRNINSIKICSFSMGMIATLIGAVGSVINFLSGLAPARYQEYEQQKSTLQREVYSPLYTELEDATAGQLPRSDEGENWYHTYHSKWEDVEPHLKVDVEQSISESLDGYVDMLHQLEEEERKIEEIHIPPGDSLLEMASPDTDDFVRMYSHQFVKAESPGDLRTRLKEHVDGRFTGIIENTEADYPDRDWAAEMFQRVEEEHITIADILDLESEPAALEQLWDNIHERRVLYHKLQERVEQVTEQIESELSRSTVSFILESWKP